MNTHVCEPKEILRTKSSDSLNLDTSKPLVVPRYQDTLRMVSKLHSRVDCEVLYEKKMDLWTDPQIGLEINGNELWQLSRMVHEAIGSMFTKYKYNPFTDKYIQEALHTLQSTIRRVNCPCWTV